MPGGAARRWPGGAWSVRLASTINDEPAAQLWDTAGQLVPKYGFTRSAPGADGARLWSHRSATPILAIFASSRLRHVQLCELETFAIEADGTVAWRIAHSDVVTEAAMVGGRLVLTGYGGGVNAWTPRRVVDRLTRLTAARRVDRAWTSTRCGSKFVDMCH